MRGRSALAALALYLAIAVALFGVAVLPRPASTFIGSVVGNDVSAYVWFLAWWPHAILHGLNPFRPEVVWAPTGYNLAWSASVPGLALLMSPVTLAFGPVVAYNIATLLSPVVSAWAAFLLCRRLAGRVGPALVGGYIYGFSTYVVGHMQGHLNMSPAFVAPLVALLVIRRLDDEVSTRRFVVGLAALLVFQFTLFTEIFATLTLFGGIAFVLALAMLGPQVRGRLWRMVAPIAAAYGVAAVALAPYLYYLFAFGFPRDQLHEMEPYSIDLLNFVIPTPSAFFHLVFFPVAKTFTGNFSESVGYVGLPLIAIAYLFGRSHGGTRAGRWALVTLGVVCLAALGPNLHIAGLRTITLPWHLMLKLPLINHAATGRFMMYAFLILGAIAAVWLARGPGWAWLRWTLAGLAVACLLPNVWYWPLRSAWAADLDLPAFFSSGAYRQHLAPGQNTLILPYSERGNSSLWQAYTGMYFRMAGGYVGVPAPEFLRWPIVYTFYSGGLMPNHGPQLRAFLDAHDVRTVILADGTEGPWPKLLATLGVEPLHVGGVSLYRVPGVRTDHRSLTRLEMDQASSLAQVAALVVAADDYQHAGLALDMLAPVHVIALGLVPGYWEVYPETGRNRERMRHLQTRNGLWIGPWEPKMTSIGITGSAAALRPVAARYGRHAAKVLFPYPREAGAALPDGQGQLVMVFSREGLSAARAETTKILGD